MTFTLILGGARSGKSEHAERLIEAHPKPWIYIATAQALDDEMGERIKVHQSRRTGEWVTIEAPLALPDVIRREGNRKSLLVDCVTLWLSNLLVSNADVDSAKEDLLSACHENTGTLILVSSEVGFGIVPENALARKFRDQLGTLNQALSKQADHVVLTVAGLPLQLK